MPYVLCALPAVFLQKFNANLPQILHRQTDRINIRSLIMISDTEM